MNGDMLTGFFLQSAKSAGMRRMLAAWVQGELAVRYRRESVWLSRGELLVQVWISRWWWFALGLRHAFVWWKVRRIVRRGVANLHVEVSWRIKIR